MENKMRYQQVANLRKYPFCRAVHYFFNLDDFPRVPGHLSYVADDSNALKNTFSNDFNELNQVTYGQVLNRRMFGLAVNGQDLSFKYYNEADHTFRLTQNRVRAVEDVGAWFKARFA